MTNIIPLNLKNKRPEFKYLNILSMMFLTIMLGTYVLAYKMISFGHFIQSGGIFIFPINYALIDIITEVYGFEYTKKILKDAFICCLFFALVVPLIAILPYPANSPHQESYKFILGNVFRFFIANSIGIGIGFFLNGHLIAKWKIILNGKHFWLRSIASSSIGELITSIIADIIAFVGMGNFLELIKLMLAIYIVKFLYTIILALPNTLLMMHLKLKEGISLMEDSSLNFNPFDNNVNEKNNVLKSSTPFA